LQGEGQEFESPRLHHLSAEPGGGPYEEPAPAPGLQDEGIEYRVDPDDPKVLERRFCDGSSLRAVDVCPARIGIP
jgi:hypothetical protein